MHRLVAIIPLLLWIQTFGLLQNVAAKNLSDHVRDFLRNRIETAGIPHKISVGEEVIHASIALPRFYEARAYPCTFALLDSMCGMGRAWSILLETFMDATNGWMRPFEKKHLQRSPVRLMQPPPLLICGVSERR